VCFFKGEYALKRKYLLCFILALLPLLITAVALCFLPDIIPAHYNAAGEIDRLGSKYEQLIFPAVTLGMYAFFILLARREAKNGRTGNEKVLLITGAATLALFDAMAAYFTYLAFSYSGGETADSSVVFRLVSVGTGVMLIAAGAVLPKASRNTIVGLRTVWSMKNDRVWQKSQRFGGVSLIICALCAIISCVFIEGIGCIFVLSGLLIAVAALSVAASYRIYKKDLEEHGDE